MFKIMFNAALVLLIMVAGIRCAPEEPVTEQELQQLDSLYRHRNYFQLDRRLGELSRQNRPIIVFYRAAVEKAFNHLLESNRFLDRLINDAITADTLQTAALSMKMNNYLRMHAYSEALSTAVTLLHDPGLREDRKSDIQNTRLILQALRDTPPQQIEKSDDSILKLKGTHIDVNLNSHVRDYAYDTGANYSILMASEAREVGLEIIEAGFDVGTATGKKLKGDLAVADSLIIGSMFLRNVVFLVFPDNALTFPGGFQLRGIIGFPVLEAMGELRFQDDTIFIPEKVPERRIMNLALDDLTPLITFAFTSDTLLGRLDTGATETVFYEPFYRTYFSGMIDSSRIDTTRYGGVGGVVSYPVYRLENIQIGIAGETVMLDSTFAHTTGLGSTAESYLYANIGLDAIQNFDRYILNFRDMAFVVE